MSPHTRGLVAALLVAAPVVVGAVYTLLAALGVVGLDGGGGVSGARITAVLSERTVWEGLGWSVWVAAASTSLATAAATVLALFLRGDTASERTARALAVLPLPVPHMVAAVCALLVLGQSGLLSRAGHALGLLSSPAQMPALVYDPAGVGLILALAWKEVPFLALVAFSLVAGRGALLEETARGLGAGRRDVLLRVTLPLLWRGMLPAVVAVFTFAAGSYETAALLAPSDPLALPLLTMERYTSASLRERPDAFVLALLALALAAVAVALHEGLRARWEGPAA